MCLEIKDFYINQEKRFIAVRSNLCYFQCTFHFDCTVPENCGRKLFLYCWANLRNIHGFDCLLLLRLVLSAGREKSLLEQVKWRAATSLVAINHFTTKDECGWANLNPCKTYSPCDTERGLSRMCL